MVLYRSKTLHKSSSEMNNVMYGMMCRIPDVALPGLGDAGHGPQLLHLAEERGQARVSQEGGVVGQSWNVSSKEYVRYVENIKFRPS
jgi:hypothetical protein